MFIFYSLECKKKGSVWLKWGPQKTRRGGGGGGGGGVHFFTSYIYIQSKTLRKWIKIKSKSHIIMGCPSDISMCTAGYIKKQKRITIMDCKLAVSSCNSPILICHVQGCIIEYQDLLINGCRRIRLFWRGRMAIFESCGKLYIMPCTILIFFHQNE